jgi:hypothetical protein
MRHCRGKGVPAPFGGRRLIGGKPNPLSVPAAQTGGRRRKGGFLPLLAPLLSFAAPILSQVLGSAASTAVAKKMGGSRGGKRKMNPGLRAYLEKKYGKKIRGGRRGRGTSTLYNV